MKRKRAVYTMVFNESVFLPLWLNYYSQFFEAQDIYVLDHGTTDGSTDREGFQRRPVDHHVVDCIRQRDTVQHMQHCLLELYDTVLYTDCDEIVAPDPRNGDLGDYLDSFTGDFVTCIGYDLLHRSDESKIDLSQPILPQRNFWFPNDYSCKPLLSRVRLDWNLGCHTLKNNNVKKDSLYLIHLHRMDYDVCLQRHKNIKVRPYNNEDLNNGWGIQRLIVEKDHFDTWFYTDSGATAAEQIPDYWKQVI